MGVPPSVCPPPGKALAPVASALNCLMPASSLCASGGGASVERLPEESGRGTKVQQREDGCEGDDLRLGVGTSDLVHLALALDEGEGRHGRHAVRARDLLRLVDVDLAEGDGGILRGEFLKDGRDGVLRAGSRGQLACLSSAQRLETLEHELAISSIAALSSRPSRRRARNGSKGKGGAALTQGPHHAAWKSIWRGRRASAAVLEAAVVETDEVGGGGGGEATHDNEGSALARKQLVALVEGRQVGDCSHGGCRARG